jgi:hypothetical protein
MDVRERLIGTQATKNFSRDDLDLLVIDKVFDLAKEAAAHSQRG